MKLDVKICGLKDEVSISAALAGGASHIGFIFFEKSPRNVALGSAAELRKLAKDRALAVAVAVNASDAILDEIVRNVEPDLLQLHGSETPERVREVRDRYGLPVMKALAVSGRADIAQAKAFAGAADRILFDAKPPVDSPVPGGHGVAFDWNLLAALDPDMDYMLSGGLNADNIATALSIASPSGIDVSSGVESAPGVKRVELIANLFSALRKIKEPDI